MMEKNKENTGYFKNLFESKIFIITFFCIMLLLRLLYLDADPSFVKRVSDIGDEGVWVHNARTLFLFEDIAPDEFTQSLSVSPLNTALMMGSFYLFGVGTYQARLPSALAGWLTLIILYFFLKKVWGKKAAVIGVLILGLNEAFLIYNKLAFGISLEAMFLLLSFFLWYQGQEKNNFYILSGMSFALAILSKLSAYYSALIFVVLWLLQLHRKETGVCSIFLFGVGVIIPLIPYFFFLFSYWGLLSTNFLVLKNHYGSGGKIIINLFRSFSNNFFGLPSVFLLIVLSSFYFLRENTIKKLRSMTISSTELIAVCWLVIGFVLLIFLSDLSDRRFFSLIIPLSILSTRLFLEEESIDLNSTLEKMNENRYPAGSWKILRENILYAVLFSFPISSLIISSLSLYFCNPISVCEERQGYMVLFFSGVFLLFLIALNFIKGNIRKYFLRFSLISSVAILLFIPLLTLLRHFSRHYAIITSTMSKETGYLIGSALFMMILIIMYVVLSFHFKNLLLFKSTSIKKIFLLYFVISSMLISITIIAPAFSFTESSRSLDPLLKNAEAGGSLVHVQTLAFDASYLPIWINKKGNLKEINRNYDMSRIKYIFAREMMDGKATAEPVDLRSYYETSLLIKRLYLYPYPFTDKYRMVVAVYRVDGYKEQGSIEELAQATIMKSTRILVSHPYVPPTFR